MGRQSWHRTSTVEDFVRHVLPTQRFHSCQTLTKIMVQVVGQWMRYWRPVVYGGYAPATLRRRRLVDIRAHGDAPTGKRPFSTFLSILEGDEGTPPVAGWSCVYEGRWGRRRRRSGGARRRCWTRTEKGRIFERRLRSSVKSIQVPFFLLLPSFHPALDPAPVLVSFPLAA